jgi:2-keto-4-pentenoate hydratase/2-oxohepta-3-ene-1,7-dioic acid hydratase in catechol pathway
MTTRNATATANAIANTTMRCGYNGEMRRESATAKMRADFLHFVAEL